jgi:eukaryotic-like serine/threonine-protein kinase
LDPQPSDLLANSVEAALAGKQYRVVESIGRGGMGEVYLVAHTVLKKRFALKVIHPRYAHDARFVDRMRIEAQATARLHHKNIVDVVDFWVSADGRPCMVMELLRGATVAHELMVRGAFPIAEAVDYTVQLLLALSAAHALGVVHRDIKPENLFLHRIQDRAPVLKVLDFGVARVLPQASERAPQPLNQPTATGKVLGTPRFASPEGLRGEKVDARADVFSAGLMLYVMLTRRGPYDLMTITDDPETFRAPPLSQLASIAVPAELEAIASKAIQWNRSDRYQSASDFAKDLAIFTCEVEKPAK